MSKFHDETESERALRVALDERRREAEELLPKLRRMRPHLENIPGALEQWQKTLDATEKYLRDNARERNLGDKN